MEKTGLVERTTCPTDRRGVWAQLTETGYAVLREAAPGHVAAVRRNFVDAVTPEDWAAVGRVFAAVLAVPRDDTVEAADDRG
jgi:DNA-binding MarR family transcriptional regulator